jgi:hypothetical protein
MIDVTEVFMDVRFRWSVPESGHEWRTLKGEQRLVWTEEKKGGFTEEFSPEAGLFRKFAALDTRSRQQQDRILEFADTYGDILALPGSSFVRLLGEGAAPPEDGNYRRIVRGHATLKVWRYTIQRMSRAVNLWDQSNDENSGKAARLQARAALQQEIESAMRDTATPRCVRLCLNQKLELFVYPVNLLAFMWLTLARLVSGEIVEQPCMGKSKECLGYIYTGSGTGLRKAGTTTCSTACRKWKERHPA